jgi:hypothetical protein
MSPALTWPPSNQVLIPRGGSDYNSQQPGQPEVLGRRSKALWEMESRRVAPAAGTSEGRRVDGEDGVRLQWKQPAEPLSPDPSLSVLRGGGGTHAHSLPFLKVRQSMSPLPHPSLLRTPGSAAPAQTSNQELFQAGPDQRDLSEKGRRGGWGWRGGTVRKGLSTCVGKNNDQQAICK